MTTFMWTRGYSHEFGAFVRNLCRRTMAEFDSESNSFVNGFSTLRVLSHPESKVTLLEKTPRCSNIEPRLPSCVNKYSGDATKLLSP